MPWLTGQTAVLALLVCSVGLAVGYVLGRRQPATPPPPAPSSDAPPASDAPPPMPPDPRPPVEPRPDDETVADLRAQLHASRSALQSAVRRMEEQRRAIEVLEADLEHHSAALEAAHRDLVRARMGWEAPTDRSDADGG